MTVTHRHAATQKKSLTLRQALLHNRCEMRRSALRAVAPAAAVLCGSQWFTSQRAEHDEASIGGRSSLNIDLLGKLVRDSLSLITSNNTARCCGIVGVVGTDDARGFLLEGLRVLQNRGYDSAGMATIVPEHMMDKGTSVHGWATPRRLGSWSAI